MAERAKKVLIVDDASLVRLYYRQILEAAGYLVDEALNGLEALEKLDAALHDMIIVDVNMPKMDGFTFLATLRRQGTPESSIPAIIVSTEAGPQDRIAARSAGANFYLVKPVSDTVLTRYVDMFCGCSP
jgi:two-component system chemotaxis response regulator CheY